jgi:hypothetical protein
MHAQTAMRLALISLDHHIVIHVLLCLYLVLYATPLLCTTTDVAEAMKPGRIQKRVLQLGLSILRTSPRLRQQWAVALHDTAVSGPNGFDLDMN